MIKKIVVFFLAVLCSLTACENEIPVTPVIPVKPEPPFIAEPKPGPENPSERVSRTVLVYMEADNTLSNFSHQNINSMLKGAANGNLNGGNLLVYTDPQNDVPHLLQLKADKNGVMFTDTIKTYSEQNSASVLAMREVINFVVRSYPSDNYGLDVWSHGSAWLPSNHASLTKTRAIGQDGTDWMEIDQLKEALPDGLFDFVVFDACNMASVEVAYELRNKVNYVVASATEVMGAGFPYELIVKDMFASTENPEDICKSFYSYYSNSRNSSPYGSVSLIKTDALEPLKDITREIIMRDSTKAVTFSLDTVQFCDMLSKNGRMLYDMGQYVSVLATDEQYEQFQTCLKNAVPYAKNTSFVYFGLKGAVNLSKDLCGLSIYVMQPHYAGLNNWYTRLDWYKGVYN